ncbi:hypothetical protein G6F40_015816 [Rhizopus arrhizus]|nr:hypothetical protein G6F40_015816 [Rhizopus arrhizus]
MLQLLRDELTGCIGCGCLCRPWSARVLPDGDRFATLDAFHRALEGQRRALCAHRFEAGEVGAIACYRLLQHGRADGVDADASQLHGRAAHKTVDGGIDRRGVGAEADGFVADDAAG